MEPLATTQDSIYKGQISLIQPLKGYRFGMDAMLLAAALTAKPEQHILELGCGVGAAMLGAAYRHPECQFTGIEREKDYIACTYQNITANGMDARVHAVQGDVTDKALFKQLGLFDHVILNPPYFQADHSNALMAALRRVARHEEDDGLAQWLRSANRFLRAKGSVTIIHSAERVNDIVNGLQGFCGAIRIFPLWPNAQDNAKRVIVQGVKGSRAPLQILQGLVLHSDQDSYYADRADAVINYGHSLWG